MALVTLGEYARQHNRKPVSARAMAERGRFATAVKHGKTWLIDADEPYPDGRRAAERADRPAPSTHAGFSALSPWPSSINSEEEAWLGRYGRYGCLTFMTGLPAYGLGTDTDMAHELTVAERPTLDSFLFRMRGGERKARQCDITVYGLDAMLDRMRGGTGTCGELLLLPDTAIVQADDLGRMVLALRRDLLTRQCIIGLSVSADRQAERAERDHDLDALVRALVLIRCTVRLLETGRARLECGKRDAKKLRALRDESPSVLPHYLRDYRQLSERARGLAAGRNRMRPALSDAEYRRLIRPVLKAALDLAR